MGKGADTEDMREVNSKWDLSLPVKSIPVKGRELRIEVEHLEFTNGRTGKKRYKVHINIGRSNSPTVIVLPPDRYQEAYATVLQRLGDRQYDVRVVDGIVKIFPRGLDF
jgi:hypothetical protein